MADLKVRLVAARATPLERKPAVAGPKVFLVLLRRPCRNDPRTDPIYECGSFGCTGCHSTTLFNPRHATDLEGAMLAFIQGGPGGFALVLLTPPVTVKEWADRCEARWTPADMPFKYTEAPILVRNDGYSDFSSVLPLARKSRQTTADGRTRSLMQRLASKLRSRVGSLPAEMATQVIAVYDQRRGSAPSSDIATTYDEALPYATRVDRNRENTYRRIIRGLKRVGH